MAANIYAGIFLEGELIGIVNLSDPDSANDGLHTALTEHTGENDWDMDFITPTPEDVSNISNTHTVKMKSNDIEYNIVLQRTWVY